MAESPLFSPDDVRGAHAAAAGAAAAAAASAVAAAGSAGAAATATGGSAAQFCMSLEEAEHALSGGAADVDYDASLEAARIREACALPPGSRAAALASAVAAAKAAQLHAARAAGGGYAAPGGGANDGGSPGSSDGGDGGGGGGDSIDLWALGCELRARHGYLARLRRRAAGGAGSRAGGPRQYFRSLRHSFLIVRPPDGDQGARLAACLRFFCRCLLFGTA